MPYRIDDVAIELFPAAEVVEQALVSFGTPLSQLVNAFRGYQCVAAPTVGRGYQMDIAADLEEYLDRTLSSAKVRATRSRYELKYSDELGQHADFGLVRDDQEARVLFEIEFRPNYEKDLVKFQIGANEGRLAVAVMVVATDRRSLNPSYTTMPEFAGITRVVRALRPGYPLVIIGLSGHHAG